MTDERNVQRKMAANLLDHMDDAPGSDDADYYRAVFDSLAEGLCVVEVITDPSGASDYRFLEVNAAFEETTGLRDVIGTTYRHLAKPIGVLDPDAGARIAQTGTPERFTAVSEHHEDASRFDAYAFRLGPEGSRRVAVHFTDVTRRTLSDSELADRRVQFGSLFERAPIGVFLVDEDLRLVHVNPAAATVFGSVPELLGREIEQVMRLVWHDPLADTILPALRRTLESGAPYREAELADVRDEDGVDHYYDWHIDRILMPDGRLGIVCYFTDVSPQVRARRLLARSQRHYRAMLERIHQGFCVLEVLFDEAGRPVDYRFLETNSAFQELTGMSDVIGRTFRDVTPDVEPFWLDVYGSVAKTGVSKRFNDYAAHSSRWFDVSAVHVGDADDCTVAVLFHDVTELKTAEDALQQSVAQLRHRLHHDELTGLPNRIVFEERLQLAVAEAARYDRRLAVLFIDLDSFKDVNDRLGHTSGDVVLKAVAQRLLTTLRTSDTLARMHGDEFVALLPEIKDAHDVESLGRALVAEACRPVAVGEELVEVSVSIGVSLFPTHAQDARELLRTADAAMYQSKAGGKSTVRIFGPLVPVTSRG